ncbi:hypothetical protein BTVI_96977 [Pitangus sulphuratus]|nr:hypothetical protein BTVI_96977 [Pitangus sulphuratus]
MVEFGQIVLSLDQQPHLPAFLQATSVQKCMGSVLCISIQFVSEDFRGHEQPHNNNDNHTAITQHLQDGQGIRSSQHGFREGQSCPTNLISFYDQVTRLVD